MVNVVPLSLQGRLAPRMGLQEVYECLQRWTRLAPAGIVKKESDRARRPILQQGNETRSLDVSAGRADRQARKANAVQGGTQRKIAVADDEGPLDHDLQALSPPLECPRRHRTAREAVTDAIVGPEVIRHPRTRVATQVVR